MNNHPLQGLSDKSPFRSINTFFSLFFLFITILAADEVSAQTAVWRYVMTAPDGGNTYLNDEIKILPNRNKTDWEEVIKPDRSSMVGLTEWDCRHKRLLTRRVTLYKPDGMLILSKKNSLFSDESRSKLTGHSPENNEFLRKRTCALSGLHTPLG